MVSNHLKELLKQNFWHKIQMKGFYQLNHINLIFQVQNVFCEKITFKQFCNKNFAYLMLIVKQKFSQTNYIQKGF